VARKKVVATAVTGAVFGMLALVLGVVPAPPLFMRWLSNFGSVLIILGGLLMIAGWLVNLWEWALDSDAPNGP